MSKTCKICNIEKSSFEYYGKPTNKDFLDTVCIECRIKENKVRYYSDPAASKEKNRKRYQRRKELMFHQMINSKTNKL